MTDSGATNAGPGWTRDKRYYFEDGSCILLVDGVLFNVHRSMMSRDGSTFGPMFTLPQGKNEEGRSDETPIVLHGDTADEFRHFLSVLYALPPELQTLTSPSANLAGLISIARLSNKYAFRSLETWSLEAIQTYVNRKPSPILASIPSPSIYVYTRTPATSDDPFSPEGSTVHLTRLISLAQLCGHEPLLNTMINFLRELMSTSLHYAYLAMTLSDDLNLRSLRGSAYLEVLQRSVIMKPLEIDLGLGHRIPSGRRGNLSSSPGDTANLALGAMANAVAPLSAIGGGAAFIAPAAPAAAAGGGPISTTGPNTLSMTLSMTTTTSTSTSASTDPSSQQRLTPRILLPITDAQRLRLLSGYYRLSLTWEQLKLTPPEFEHASACSMTWHQPACTQAWVDFWKDKTKSEGVLSLGAADVLGKLRAVQKEYERWGSAAYMHADCRTCTRRRMADVIKKVEDSLSEYFEDPGISAGS